jgi:hypothetical protein
VAAPPASRNQALRSLMRCLTRPGYTSAAPRLSVPPSLTRPRRRWPFMIDLPCVHARANEVHDCHSATLQARGGVEGRGYSAVTIHRERRHLADDHADSSRVNRASETASYRLRQPGNSSAGCGFDPHGAHRTSVNPRHNKGDQPVQGTNAGTNARHLLSPSSVSEAGGRPGFQASSAPRFPALEARRPR